VTEHEKLMLTRHLSRAARQYEADANELLLLMAAVGKDTADSYSKLATRLRGYAADCNKSIERLNRK